jgi:hypothetical protein
MAAMTAGAIAAAITQMEQQRREQEQGGQGYGGTKGLMLNVADNMIPFARGPRPMNLEGGPVYRGGAGRGRGEVINFNDAVFNRMPQVSPAERYKLAVEEQQAARAAAQPAPVPTPAPLGPATISRMPGVERLPTRPPIMQRGPKTEQAINAADNVTRIEPARTGEIDWGSWAKAQGFPSAERVRKGAPALKQNWGMTDNEIKLYFQQLMQKGEL